MWKTLRVDPKEFNLRATLTSGQAFRWYFCNESNEWRGIIGNQLWRLRQSKSSEPVSFYAPSDVSSDPKDLINYFHLSTNLSDLISQWEMNDQLFASYSKMDDNLPNISQLCRSDAFGIRLLRQEPVETLFAFITSANNNVTRISNLLNSLCERFGQKVHSGTITHWLFPSVHTLANAGMEEELKKLGFGYRSKFIPAAARYLLEHGGEIRLEQLRNCSTEEARDFLIQLPGVGNKVADCICLYALDKLTVVPVDVHILHAAVERKLVTKSAAQTGHLTLSVYRDISSRLTKLWGTHAGWAQAIDFATRMRNNSGSKSKRPRI